ncbi:MFS general substrate transporter [Mycena olivaceomarginata]|nr:MFS general substrate transporter [Mycena olivaceomarginata]
MPSDEHVQDEFTPNHESRIPKQEESEPEPRSIYTPVEKWFIVALIAFGVCSGHHVHSIPRTRSGTLADYFRRGLMFICCFSYRHPVSVSRSSRPTLLLLRCLQSAGSASTIALGAGVIGDISTLRNGAVFWGVQRWTDGCAVILILSVLFPPFIHLFNSIHPPVLVSTAFSPKPSAPSSATAASSRLPSRPLSPSSGGALPNSLPLPLCPHPQTIPKPSPPSVQPGHINSAHARRSWGFVILNHLAIGGGMLIGSASSGQLLDWDYQRVKRSILAKTEKTTESHDEARLRLLIFLTCFVASCAAYGWCIERQGSSVTACNNLVRCALSAAFVAVIQPILSVLGAGWTYVLLAGMIRIGPRCRVKRRRSKAAGAQEEN